MICRRSLLQLTLAVLWLAVVPIAVCAQAPPAHPQYGAYGFDTDGQDQSVRPGNGFFRFASGAWIDRTPIPADKAGYSLRSAMTDLTEGRLHEMMEAAAARATNEPSDLEGKVGAFYRSFMDTARIEALGANALSPWLDAVRRAKTRADLSALMGRDNRDFYGTLFNTFPDVDIKDPVHYALYVTQAGLGMPDRDYYLEPSFAIQKAKYGEYVATMLHLEGWPNPDANAKAVVAFESAVAAASWPKTEQRDPAKTYNPMTMAQLEKLAPGFGWRAFLGSAGMGSLDRVIVSEKSAFPKLAAIYARTPLSTLRAWIAFTVADNAAPYLSTPFVNASFEMRNKTLSGQQVLAARWKRGVRTVSGGDFGAGDRFDRFGNMGWGVGELYSAKYFPPESKAAIESLVQNLKAAYHARIERLDWMSPETRVSALKKLETYNIKVGYPTKPRDYSSLLIRADDLLGNVQRAGDQEWMFYIARQAAPVDRDDWLMTPQTNDAYNGSLRDIVFPAGILQPPIFDANADPAFNYGAAGGVIGHELTHGFDDEGRKFDAEGKLNDWWQPADAKTFDARAARLGAQYDAYQPLPGVHINGALTMGENIADLGGLTLALEAYRTSLNGQPAPVLGGMTGDQRVFLGWAQAWRGKSRDEAVRRQVTSDPHSPRIYRVDGVVRNIDEWYEAFDVKPGDSLYLAPTDRVHIW
ncbi:MAG: M13 family metallopeptidase [Candidatus Eisenbacteria bacterium]